MSAELNGTDRGTGDEVERLRIAVRDSAQELRFSRLIQAESRRDAEVSREELVEIRRHRDQLQAELAVARAELDAAIRERGQVAARSNSPSDAPVEQWHERAAAAEQRCAEIEAWTPVRVAFRVQAFLLRHPTLRRIALRIGRILAPRSG